MKLPFASSTTTGSAALALSNLLVDKTKRSFPLTSTLSTRYASEFQARLSRLAGNWAQSGTIDAGSEDVAGDWLVQRCQSGRMARLDREGKCFCGTLADTESSLCEGFDNNDRRTVCIEDLRELNKEGNDHALRKEPTCGLEFLEGFDPSSCPVGFVRIGQESGEEGTHFICQDAASPYSCGPQQIDCYAQEGVLRTQCKDSVCDPIMCKEGWRFKLTEVDGDAEAGTTVTSHCVKPKPLFFNSDAVRY
ncbi:uncharacterized protein JCM6883_000856 [Sporobolomyces salmoneus]|uniref:uncharacterized protein n=1 Tax=Sporobolomyces salmoneus TaxID=183962 RepID=UPI00317AF89F